MQTGNREFNGKNQFWTPSNLGLTQSLIDNKLNNIDNSDLLSKTEANETYLKKSDVSNLQYQKLIYTYGSVKSFFLLQDIPIYYIHNRGTSTKNSLWMDFKIPSTITKTLKIVKIRFYAYITLNDSGSELDWINDLNCSLTADKDEAMKGTIHKGFYIASKPLDDKLYSYFEINEIIYGNPKYLYLHFFYNCNSTNLTKYNNNKIYIVFDENHEDLSMTVEYFGIN